MTGTVTNPIPEVDMIELRLYSIGKSIVVSTTPSLNFEESYVPDERTYPSEKSSDTVGKPLISVSKSRVLFSVSSVSGNIVVLLSDSKSVCASVSTDIAESES